MLWAHSGTCTACPASTCGPGAVLRGCRAFSRGRCVPEETALKLDAGEHVRLDGTAISNQGPLTIELWMYLRSGGTGSPVIFDFGSDDRSASIDWFLMEDKPTFYAVCYVERHCFPGCSPTLPVLLVPCCGNLGCLGIGKLYVQGNLVASGAGTSASAWVRPSDLHSGEGLLTTRWEAFGVSSTRSLGAARTAGQIAAYADPAAAFVDFAAVDLQLFYRFDEMAVSSKRSR